jgi:hypothetical protein
MSTLTARLNPARRSRILPTAIAVATLAAAGASGAGIAAATSGGHGSTRALTATNQIQRLESKGYIATACTRAGTLMVNPNTHQRVTVKLV